ncbi:MAG: RagB/SusD family nutrient uptake outer membrane protein [Bacteroidales bacterium]|nr:RagB/SusD family nutrient uptake outer membrane protein [Candidatus Cacconaster merdequi]
MKRIYLILSIVVLAATMTSCDKFLTRDPLNKQTNASYWQSETALKTYAQDFYSSYFQGYGTDYSVFAGYNTGDNYVDDYIQGGGTSEFAVSNIAGYNSSHTWGDQYGIIYKANVMIEKIPDMTISDEAKNHWMGVAKFFRALAYSKILRIYGGCPYYDSVTDPADTDALYKDRDSYVTVAKGVLADFQYAVDNMRADDGKLQVNKYVAGAYMSRELLYHGTWLKYHENNTTDAKAMLEGAVKGAQVVMAGPFAIGNTYNALFSSDELAGNPEIIFYREYTDGVQCNSLISYVSIEPTQRGGSCEDAIASYLCSDGLPIGQSPIFKGGKYNEFNKGAFENRDPRLYDTFVDSLRIQGATGVTYYQSQSPTGYATKKFLNEEWMRDGSSYISSTLKSPIDGPCIRFAEVLLNYAEARYEVSKIGGAAFAQADLDNSINKIRARQIKRWNTAAKDYDKEAQPAMPPMVLAGSSISANGVVINDPARDPEVDPILWEIRRERRVELMMEGRRGDDLRRWGKFAYLNSEDKDGNPSLTFLGAYINLDEEPFNKITGGIQLFDPEDPTNTAARKGYLKYGYKKGYRVFNNDKYYLKAIPNAEVIRYKDKGYTLTQNPGWEN